jgi:Tol biopolymer transport system component
MAEARSKPTVPALMVLVLALSTAACQPTATPTFGPTPTPTPVSPPTTWLVTHDDKLISLYNTDTGQRVDLELPPLWSPELDLAEIPDTGLVAMRTASDREGGSDLTLAVVRLPQGDVLRRLPLLSEDVSEWIRRTDDTFLPDHELEEVTGAVTGRWFRALWSPDGHTLAFSATLGASGTDVYVYDALQDDVRQLTDRVSQEVVLGWSPDGEWVLYAEARGLGDHDGGYSPQRIAAASIRTGEHRQLYELQTGVRLEIVGWLSDAEVVLRGADDVFEQSADLWLLDLDRGQATLIYEGMFFSADLDPESGTLGLSWHDDPYLGDLGDGVAILRPGQALSPVPDPWQHEFWGPVRWYPQLERFFASSDLGTLAFTSDGEPAEVFENENCLPATSPDGRWLAFGACTQSDGMFGLAGLRIYTPKGKQALELEADFVYAAAWAPGSAQLYYLRDDIAGPVLVQAEIPGGRTRVLYPVTWPSLALIQPSGAVAQMVRHRPTGFPSPTPAATPEPSPTPQVSLHAGGPWLVGMTDAGPVAMNPDGTGLTHLFAAAVQGDQTPWLASDISPAGWIAAVVEGTEAQPRTLLVGRPGVGVARQIPILTPELQAEIDQPDEDGRSKRWSQDVYLAFDDWMDTLMWSPDGRTLAYVAAVDGPSADIYSYDTVTDEIHRLTDGPNQPRLLGWSPDGRWMLHLEIQDITLGDGIWWTTLGLWAAAAEGSEARQVPVLGRRVILVGWASPTQFMLTYYENGPRPPQQIDLVDLAAGPVSTLYRGSAYGWAVDPGTGTIALPVDPDSGAGGEALEPGLYLLSAGRPAPQLVAHSDPDKQPYLAFADTPVWSPEFEAFLVQTGEDQVVLISTEGEIVRTIEDACSLPRPSPDGRWLTLRPCSRTAFGLELRSEVDGSVHDVHLGDFNDYFWSPDSSGIYYLQGEHPEPERLMFVPIPEGEPRLIHPDSGLGSWDESVMFVSGP